MKITRKVAVPGKYGMRFEDREFELTPQELMKAYEEKLYEHLIADIEVQYNEMSKNETLAVSFEELKKNEEVMLSILQNIRFRDVDEGYWEFIENQIRAKVFELSKGV